MRLALMLLILGFVVSAPAHAQVYTVLRGPQCPGPVEPFTQQIWSALEQPGRTSGYYCPEPAGPPERPVDPRKYANIRTVAVLSGIGSVVTINKRRAIGSVAKDNLNARRHLRPVLHEHAIGCVNRRPDSDLSRAC